MGPGERGSAKRGGEWMERRGAAKRAIGLVIPIWPQEQGTRDTARDENMVPIFSVHSPNKSV